MAPKRKRKFGPGDAVLVIWRDASHSSEHDPDATLYMHSLGFLLEGDEKHVQIAQTIDPSGEVAPCDVLNVPRELVDEIKRVR
jgi:hypothetical protein